VTRRKILLFDLTLCCLRCQSTRGVKTDKKQQTFRVANFPCVGIDGLTITPADIHGMAYAYVIKVFATKLVTIYPEPLSTRSLYAFRCTYGHHETVASDPGCDLTAEGVQQYLAWSGQTHRTSLVDQHQSNGVEVINRQVMVLLRALVCDRQIQNNWSQIQNIGTVQFIINEHISTETSTSAFSLTFDKLDEIYMRFPEDKDLNSAENDYVSLLISLRETAAACIASKEYQRAGPLTLDIFQEGDLILYDLKDTHILHACM